MTVEIIPWSIPQKLCCGAGAEIHDPWICSQMRFQLPYDAQLML